MTFTTIDFETATGKRNSACAVGIVTVENGIITDEYYMLIKPPNNEYNRHTIQIHGITPKNTVNAPTFADIYSEIKKRLQGKTVVAHNESFDRSVLQKTMAENNLDYCELNISERWECTMNYAEQMTNIHRENLMNVVLLKILNCNIMKHFLTHELVQIYIRYAKNNKIKMTFNRNKILLHLILQTANKQSSFKDEYRKQIFNTIRDILQNIGTNTLPSGKVFSVTGYTDHVHIVFLMPVDISLKKLINELKRQTKEKFDKSEWFDKSFLWNKYYTITSLSSEEKVERELIRKQEEYHKHISFKEELASAMRHNKFVITDEI